MIEIELILAGILAVILIAIFLIGRSRKAKAEQLRQEREVVAEAERRRIETEKEQRRQAKEQEKVETMAEAKAAEKVSMQEPEKPATEEKVHSGLPQDSMLRRHYLTHLHMMIETVYAPAPSDSALKRHHQNMLDSTVENSLDNDAKMAKLVADYEAIKNASKQPAVKKVAAEPVKTEQAASAPSKPVLNLPEDSMLRRHYLTHVRSMIETLHGPRPTDSALKRHYDSMIAFELEDCLCCNKTLEKLECCYKEARQQEAAKAKPAAAKVETVVSKTPEPAAVKPGGKVSIIPEDSMLRRHHLTHVRFQIEDEKGPRPSDFNLKRHYEQMIDSELETYIEEAEAA